MSADDRSIELMHEHRLMVNVGTIATSVSWSGRPASNIVELHGADPRAATRRAIERAAETIRKGK